MPGPERQGIEPVLDPGPVTWVGEALSPWADEWPLKIGALVPSTYAAYGRLLHPAFDPEQEEVGWARVAEWSGRELKADSPFEDIATRKDGSRWPGSRPIDGQIDSDDCARLARLFGPFTTSASVLYCVWGGWGGLAGPEIELTPAIDSRSYRVFRGPLEAITGLVFDIEDPRSVAVLTSEVPPDEEAATDEADLADHLFCSPSLWWPDDRAWFVHTEVDARSTYIGGSEELIRTLLDDPELEVLPASLDHTVDGMYRGMPRRHD